MFEKAAPWIFRIGVALAPASLLMAGLANAQPPDASQYTSARALALQVEADAKSMLAAAESQRSSDPRFDDRVIDSYRAFASAAEKFRESLSDDDYRRMQSAYSRVVGMFVLLPETRLGVTTRDRLASQVAGLDKYYAPRFERQDEREPLTGERGMMIRLSRQLEQETRQLAATASLEARRGDRTERRMVTLFEHLSAAADRFGDVVNASGREAAEHEFRELAGIFNRAERRYPAMHPTPTVDGAMKRVANTMAAIGREMHVSADDPMYGRGSVTAPAVMSAVRGLAEEIDRKAQMAFQMAQRETESAPARRYTREYRVMRYRPDPRRNSLPDLASLASAADSLQRSVSSGRGSSSREFEQLQRAQQRAQASTDHYSPAVRDALDDVRDAVNELSTYYYAQDREYAERLW